MSEPSQNGLPGGSMAETPGIPIHPFEAYCAKAELGPVDQRLKMHEPRKGGSVHAGQEDGRLRPDELQHATCLHRGAWGPGDAVLRFPRPFHAFLSRYGPPRQLHCW